ncbi:MAG: 5'-methylthioadenosine/adenosylhomocysteine nucleosidase [Bacillales bacterium]|nr:5'-methylthioadenosine/adenosylhomocysteine nucleosidase [Bacillales bacterium]
MGKIYSLIVAAMQVEFDALKNELDSYREIEVQNEKLLEFSLNGEYYLLGLGKIGKVSTAFFLGKLFSCLTIKRVFNIGTSGGVNSSLNISDVIIATEVGYYDVDVIDFGYQMGQVPGFPKYFTSDLNFIESKKISSKFNIVKGLILSGDNFVSKRVYNKTILKDVKECLACEMEAGAVAQCCYSMNIPFVIIRSISDIVTKDDNNLDLDKNEKSVSTNSALVLLELIK